ncbi:hypothetical protein [Macellibacteroides fermentans]
MRRRDRSQNTIYKCPECKEVYRPYKMKILKCCADRRTM